MIKNKKRFLDKYVKSVFVKRLNNDNKELLFDIVVKFDISIIKVLVNWVKIGLNRIDSDVYKT